MGVAKIASRIEITGLAALVMGIVLAAGDLGPVSSAEGDTEISVGSGSGDRWITCPDHHPRAGIEVEHPRWVLGGLEDKSVVILVGPLSRSPDLRDQVFDVPGEIREDVNVLVNGRHIESLDGVATRPEEGDEVVIFPVVVGG